MKIKDKYGNQLELYQARSGQVYIAFGEKGIPLNFINIINGGLETHLRDIEDFNELKYKEFYHIS